MNHLCLVLSLIVNIVSIQISNCAECPKPEILNPCTCASNTISCGGNEAINLKHIFQRLSTAPDVVDKHFYKLYLNNTAINELPENTFEDITFESIQFDSALNLSFIHINAFTATSLTIKAIDTYRTPLNNSLPYHDFFTAFSLMPNLEAITILSANFTEIPDNAFRPLLGQQKNLNTIYFQTFQINKIGKHAFQYLTGLKSISFESSNIKSIKDNTFNSIKESNTVLMIYLQNNQLNSSSFEKNSFTNLKRPVALHLDGNQIDYLDENVFAPVLNENNLNQLSVNSLNCDDCRSFWLINNHYYDTRLQFITCKNSRKVTDNLNFYSCAKF